jgi:hypothetical protein
MCSQMTENREVTGSTPVGATRKAPAHAGVLFISGRVGMGPVAARATVALLAADLADIGSYPRPMGQTEGHIGSRQQSASVFWLPAKNLVQALKPDIFNNANSL